jgi:hypothetical protein
VRVEGFSKIKATIWPSSARSLSNAPFVKPDLDFFNSKAVWMMFFRSLLSIVFISKKFAILFLYLAILNEFAVCSNLLNASLISSMVILSAGSSLTTLSLAGTVKMAFS